MQRANAVSYTHLDVYKRQGLFLRGDLLRKAAQWGERHYPGQQQQNKRAKKTLHLNQRLLYSWLGLAEMETAHVIL